MSHRAVGVWHQISGRQVYQQVTDVAQFLRAQGIQKGERVAIIAENRPEWAITDFACQMLGIVDVPIYPTLTAEQTQFILRDSGARVAFVSSNEQLKKVLDVREQTDVKAVVIMDEPREQMT